MRLLQRRARRPQARKKSIRPAERYLTLGANEARGLGHNYIGTEHVLLALVRDPDGDVAALLQKLGVAPAMVDETLNGWLYGGGSSRKIDPEALAALGIDFEAVRERLEQTFGPGALERTQASCLGIAPQLKMALAFALDRANARELADEHVLLGLLTVPDSIAARALAEHGVTLETVETTAGD